MPASHERWFKVVAVALPMAVGLAAMVAFAIARGMLEVSLVHGIVQFRDPANLMRSYNYEKSGHVVLYDERLGWRNPPNLIGRSFENPLRINALGLRDGDHPYANSSGNQRILVLGDSYAWGFDVADDEIFTEVLEDSLQRVGAPVEVINTGVSGWGTDQEYLFFLDEGL